MSGKRSDNGVETPETDQCIAEANADEQSGVRS